MYRAKWGVSFPKYNHKDQFEIKRQRNEQFLRLAFFYFDTGNQI